MPRKTPGNYVPLDVNYPRDAAIRRAGEAAELLFVRSLAYSKGARTGGFIPDYDLDVVAAGLKSATRRIPALVREELWTPVDGGWLIRSWGRWNGETDGHLDASAKGNHTRWHVNKGVVDPDCDLCPESPADSGRESPGESLGESPGESQGKGREGKGSKNTPSPDGEAAFDRFYAAYPRKVGRKDAERAFQRAARDVDPERLVDAAERYAADPNQPTDRSKIPHPATWLNQGRWDDEPLPARLDGPRTPPPVGEHLPGSVVEDLIGPDVWTPPDAPAGMDSDEAWEWQRQRRLEHIAERQAAARERMGRTA